MSVYIIVCVLFIKVTTHIELHGHPKFVKTPEDHIKPIDSFYLHFKGIKVSKKNVINSHY